MKINRIPLICFLLVIISATFSSVCGLEPLDVDRFTTDPVYRDSYNAQYASSASQLVGATASYVAQVMEWE